MSSFATRQSRYRLRHSHNYSIPLFAEYSVKFRLNLIKILCCENAFKDIPGAKFKYGVMSVERLTFLPALGCLIAPGGVALADPFPGTRHVELFIASVCDAGAEVIAVQFELSVLYGCQLFAGQVW